MRYLLDTHVVWEHATKPVRLSRVARAAVDSALVADLWILDVSLYELARHLADGRIFVAKPLEALSAIAATYQLLHTDAEIAWCAASLVWSKHGGKSPHLDPADRALVAAAQLHGLTLLTADQEMHHYARTANIRVLW